jgi:hypothetical protein
VCSFAALGAQRYLWAISREGDPDPLELTVRRLVELDRTRGSELFRTLETYLDERGSVRRAADALFVHRNTLRQRLRRIREVIGIDPADPAVWFDLVLAVRLIRFREGEEGSQPHEPRCAECTARETECERPGHPLQARSGLSSFRGGR